jgi:RHS repeat-associated protein
VTADPTVRRHGKLFVPEPARPVLQLGLQRRLTREQRTGAVAFTLTHTYDPAGNRLVKSDGGARTTFAYDAANQLLTQTDATGRTTFTYDANGNPLVRRPPSGSRTTQIWDGDNQLAQVLLPAGVRNTYSYDGLGRRVQRQDSTGAAQLVWDGEDVLREVSGGSLLSQYTLRPGRYGMVLAQRRSSASQFYHLDGVGSTAGLTNATQATTDSYWYEAYGALRTSSGTSANPLRYMGGAGYYYDPDTANNLARARYYAPASARFLSRDPLAFPAPVRDRRWGRAELVSSGGLNLYGYAQANPVFYNDPSGLFVPAVAPIVLPVLIPLLVPVPVAVPVVVAAPVAVGVGTFLLVCTALDLKYCAADLARCKAFANTQAGQCAYKACLPNKYMPVEAVNQATCEAIHLAWFNTLCDARARLCYGTCGLSGVGEEPYNCMPTWCAHLCCSTKKKTCDFSHIWNRICVYQCDDGSVYHDLKGPPCPDRIIFETTP